MGAAAAAWTAAAIAAAGAVNQNQTMRHKDQDAANGIRQNMALQQKANQKIANQIHQRAQSNPAQAAEAQNAQYLDQLHQHQQFAQQQLQRQGLGEAYAERANANMSHESNYADQLAGLMAQIDAPSLQRQQENFNIGDLGTGLGVIRRNAAGNAWLSKLQAASEQANPYIQGLGQAANAYAAGVAGGQ